MPRARHDLLAWLSASHSLSEANCNAAASVVSELVANAVLHASPMPGGTLEVAWLRAGQQLKIEVTDAGGPDLPHVVDADTASMGGRGLLIVEALALAWWISRDGTRRTVHAQLDMDWPSAL